MIIIIVHLLKFDCNSVFRSDFYAGRVCVCMCFYHLLSVYVMLHSLKCPRKIITNSSTCVVTSVVLLCMYTSTVSYDLLLFSVLFFVMKSYHSSFIYVIFVFYCSVACAKVLAKGSGKYLQSGGHCRLGS